MTDQDYDAAVANALKMALQAELDCDNHPPRERPTAADTWSQGETQFTIEISGHELIASIPSTRSSVSDPNEVDESQYDRDDDGSSFSDQDDEYYDEDEEYDEDDDEQEGEYEEDYQFTRGDFDQEPPTGKLASCKLEQGQSVDSS